MRAAAICVIADVLLTAGPVAAQTTDACLSRPTFSAWLNCRIEAAVVDWAERKFRTAYRVKLGASTVAEGHELRAWASLADGKLKAAAIPEEFKMLMT